MAQEWEWIQHSDAAGQGERPGADDALGQADAAALDALVEAGFDLDRAQAADGVEPGRVAHLGALLGLLEMNTSVDPSLADVTMARVLQSRRLAALRAPAQNDALPVLSGDDAEALDAWVMAGFDAARVPASLRARAQRHDALASLVAGRVVSLAADTDGHSQPTEHEPAVREDGELLLERTLAAVQAHIDKQAEGMIFESRPRRASLRLADIVSVAAVVLIGSAVLFPVMTAVREQSRRAMCQNNLHSTAMAMSAYASEYRDSLPVVSASLGNGRWWDVGKPQHSNSANLFTLARSGYTHLERLACPGNPAAPTAIVKPEARDWRALSEVSYSYQIMHGPRPTWNDGRRMVVLADRSPVVLRAVRGESIDPFANAPNHRWAGQHVLFNDGSAIWLRTPVLDDGDNIWLPRAIEITIEQMSGRGTLDPLSGRELPGAADDVFLGP